MSRKKFLSSGFGSKLLLVAGVYFSLSVCVVLLFYVVPGLGIRVNLSPSVPVGIWKTSNTPGTALKGDYAVVPPEAQPQYRFSVERGYIPDGNFLLKKVSAVEGDVVDYDAAARSVKVNGEALFFTEIFSADSAARPLPKANFPVRLGNGDAWVSSENIRGFDSRYFGPVSADLLIKAVPVWLF